MPFKPYYDNDLRSWMGEGQEPISEARAQDMLGAWGTNGLGDQFGAAGAQGGNSEFVTVDGQEYARVGHSSGDFARRGMQVINHPQFGALVPKQAYLQEQARQKQENASEFDIGRMGVMGLGLAGTGAGLLSGFGSGSGLLQSLQAMGFQMPPGLMEMLPSPSGGGVAGGQGLNAEPWGSNLRTAGGGMDGFMTDVNPFSAGANPLAEMNFAGPGGGIAETTPGLSLSSMGTPSGMSLAPGAGLVMDGAGAGGGFWDKFIGGLGTVGKQLLMGNGTGGSGLLSNLIPGLMEGMGREKMGDQILAGMREAADRADPFRSQRPFYQQQLQQSYTDPGFFQNNPTFQALTDRAADKASASAASQGFNQSGRMLHDVSQKTQQAAAQYVLPWQEQTARNAGAYFGPGQSGQLVGQGVNAAAEGDNSFMAGLGMGLKPLTTALFGPSSGTNTSGSQQTPNVVNGGNGGGPNLLSWLFS